MSDEELNIPCVQKTIALIFETFYGVTREGGTSWTEAWLIDLGRSEEEAREGRLSDRESCWEELVDDPSWSLSQGSGEFCYLDPIGFRYYLPAAMILELRHQGRFMAWNLNLHDGKSRKQTLDKWSALTPKEVQCICDFLKCMDSMELRQDTGGFYHKHGMQTDWRDVYLSYWVSVDANPQP